MSCLDLAADELLASFVGKAMATRVTILIPKGGVDPSVCDRTATEALKVFDEVDHSCTRFDAESPLMQMNRAPSRWHSVPTTLFRAVEAAKRAHDMTRGRFDPRVLRCLCSLGYDRTLPFDGGAVRTELPSIEGHPADGQWRPRFRGGTRQVLVGSEPIDLGGIGKGLAVRWASEILGRVVENFLVEAGGDCYASGSPPGESAWRIGVEDPLHPGESACVLAVSGRAVTTSSIRLRSWVNSGRRVHHLIDPATGKPGGRGLVSVTVVSHDPADAEVWSKVLFLEGFHTIAARARRHGLAAVWINEQGVLGMSPQLTRYLLWRRD